MRRNGALAADYARRHGVPRWHDDADAIIARRDIDAVYIATLTDSHREYTLRCAAAGKPVYVEKPMGMNHAECLDMIAACRAAGVPLWVGYYRRALPRFLAVRDLIAAGAIGEVRMVTIAPASAAAGAEQFAGGAVPWRVNPALSGGGFFFEGVCHTFDFLDFLFGPIVDVRAFAGNQARRLPSRGHRRRDATVSRRACSAAAPGATPRTSTRSTTRSSAPPDASAFRRPRRCRSGSCAATRSRSSGRRSGARPPADDPDDRRRAQRERQVPEHRRVRARAPRR